MVSLADLPFALQVTVAEEMVNLAPVVVPLLAASPLIDATEGDTFMLKRIMTVLLAVFRRRRYLSWCIGALVFSLLLLIFVAIPDMRW